MSKILIFDDDRMFSNDLKQLLEFEGYESEVMNTSGQLFSVLPNISNYSVVILDIMFRRGSSLIDYPELESGEAFYNLIREEFSEIPIIILSAKNEQDIKISMDRVKTFYVPKPLDGAIEEILEVLKHV